MSPVLYLCPSLPERCRWEGEGGQILQHFTEFHPDLLVNTNTIRVNITAEENRNVLMVYGSEQYLIQLKCTKDLVEMRLRYLGSGEKAAQIRYYVEILAGNYIFSSKDMMEEYAPVRNNNGSVEVHVDVLKCTTKLLNEIILTVNFERSFLLKQICPAKSYFEDSTDDILYHPELFKSEESLDCVIEDKSDLCRTCGSLLIFPIFMCNKGHSICHNCFYKQCSACGSVVTNVRNYDLEDIAANQEYLCRYTDKGCKAKMRGTFLYKHEVFCFYCIHVCPECNWNGKYAEIDKHFRIVHPSVKLVNGSENLFPINSRLLIRNACGIFYCTSLSLSSGIEWSVLYCGPLGMSFMCDVVVRGKNDWRKTYALSRVGNKYSFTVQLSELKLAKTKKTLLTINEFT